MFWFVIVLIIVIVSFIAFYILAMKHDSKIIYSEDYILSKTYLKTDVNGNQYLTISFYSWQHNKISSIKSLYKQNVSWLSKDDYEYIITSYLGKNRVENGLFFEGEMKFSVQPKTDKSPLIVQNHNINITNSPNTNIDLSLKMNINAYSNEIKNSTEINNIDKETLLNILKEVSGKQKISKDKATTFLTVLTKYTPVLSFAKELIGLIVKFI